MRNTDTNFAQKWPSMYEAKERKAKAARIIKTLKHYYKTKNLAKLVVLDIGASTGIIDSILANSFKKVSGIDIDSEAIEFAKKKFKRKNLTFTVGDAMKLGFKNSSFDVVICTQVYEHVPNSKRLFSEILRVLKPGGVCYLAAINRIRMWEPHYDLPLLSVFPKSIANLYIRIARREKKYHENPETYWALKKLVSKFGVVEYTDKIIKNPKIFGYQHSKINLAPSFIRAFILAPLGKYFAPTFFWLLIKVSR